MGHIYLIITILAETAAVIFMKLSDGYGEMIKAGISNGIERVS